MHSKPKLRHIFSSLALSGALLSTPAWANTEPLVTIDQPGLTFSWKQVSTFDDFVMAINEDGSLWGWGKNKDGQLGIGSLEYRNTPTQIGTDSNWIYVDAADDWTLAIKADGTLWGWGDSEYLGSGDGTSIEITTPIQISSDTGWVAVSGAWDHSLALKADGTLWGWGDNDDGQLGDGTTSRDTYPMTQIGADSDWKTIFAGDMYSLAIKADGTLWAWGDNYRGQIGNGTSGVEAENNGGDSDDADQLTPVQIGLDTNWIAITGGYGHTLGLKADGSLWSWGKNRNGELGDGGTEDRSIPTRVGFDSNWSQISADWHQSSAIKDDGSIWSWGQNTYGALGDGTVDDQHLPSRIADNQSWAKVVGGDNMTLAIDADGGLWSWGDNSNGQLGNGEFGDRVSQPSNILADQQWLAFGAKYNQSSGIATDGSLWQWSNTSNSGSWGEQVWQSQLTLAQVGQDNDWSHLFVGDYFSLATKTDGSLWAWRDNLAPALLSAEQWSVPSSDAVIKTDGTLWQVQQSNPGYSLSQTGTDTDWTTVHKFGWSAYLAIKQDGTLWAWGSNFTPTPSMISTEQWSALSSETIIKSDGTLWQMQWDYPGYILVQADTDNDWSTVSTSSYHSLAIRNDGSLWGWGDNWSSQLGNSNSQEQATPIRIGTDNDWVSVTAISKNSFALKHDGTLWAWGSNSNGLLADATPRGWIETPTQITEGSSIQDTDTDGIEDELDNCPATANPEQLDLDNDGMGDVCDPDDDNDQVNDAFDICPTESALGQDANSDGCIDTAASLATMLTELPSDQLDAKTAKSLLAKINSALSSIDKGNMTAAANKIRAFKNQVNAQAGKKIDSATATLLIEFADNALAQASY
ncbi:MAG: thrombospondin type 3 repeat-containing protein [Halopseudomonas sp.]